MNNVCFVVMPIGTQKVGDLTITEDELKKKYDYIIKNAILKADPDLEVIRADEELNPGSISNDIFTKLMYSRYVIADITYPNPNVFYELGIRHAIKPGTILIRENVDFSIPFDISHLRYITYTQEPDGMYKLSGQLKKQFEFYKKHPNKPDNQFLELCSFTNYVPMVYGNPPASKEDVFSSLLTAFISAPALLDISTDSTLSDEEKQHALLSELGKDPEKTQKLFSSLIKVGLIKF